jgi:hypothetical protein
MGVKVGLSHNLMVIEHKMLRRIFGPTRKEVTGRWRQVQDESFSLLPLKVLVFNLCKMLRALHPPRDSSVPQLWSAWPF